MSVAAGSVAAVVLAAGASTRLGEPKQLARLGDEALLERAVRVAREAGCHPLFVVLGAQAAEIQAGCDLTGTTVLLNADWPEGMASSIRAGARGAGDAAGVIVLTCDQPAVTAEHLRALMHGGEVVASAYDGRRGVPAYFAGTRFKDLMALQGDAGARTLLRGAEEVELAGGELDVDTPAALAVVRRVFG